MERYDVAVIGGGAGGLMAALTAAQAGASVVLCERNNALGRKLRITGKGRCNVTNNCSVEELLAAVPRNRKFLYGAVSRFTPADAMSFFESLGVPLKTERGRRVFPVSDKAADIVAALVGAVRDAGVRIRLNARATGLRLLPADGGAEISFQDGRTVSARAVVLATGGVSYPLTGSTGDGHRFARELGLDVTPLKPSLIPVETAENFSPLSGLTLKNVALTVSHGKKTVFAEMGELLFTHFGVSGPLILSASANMQDFPADTYRMSVDLKPALSPEELDRRLVSDFTKYAARDLINSMGDLLPVKLIEPVVERAGVDPRKKTGALSKAERQALGAVLKAFAVTPTRFRPIDEAIVTCGGIHVREVNPGTMELKRFPGVCVAGELLDVDAYTGGYNLQIAFATGRLAGRTAASRRNRESASESCFD